jgi:hypothetical protein
MDLCRCDRLKQALNVPLPSLTSLNVSQCISLRMKAAILESAKGACPSHLSAHAMCYSFTDAGSIGHAASD